MSELDSNLDDVAAWVDAAVDSFDFTIAGKDQSLGRDLAGVVADGISERSEPAALDPDGTEWEANEPKYAKRKGKKYDAWQPNVRTGQMLSVKSLIGGTVVAAQEVELRYGTGQPPDSARKGDLTESDKSITDIEKAFFCSKSRPFYALDGAIVGAVVAEAGEALADHLKTL